MKGETMSLGYCDLHEEYVDEDTYEWKGCWGCLHFRFGKDFPYMFVDEVSEGLGVSESTVRRWVRKGKLRGKVFRQVRRTQSLPSPDKYHIEKESVKNQERD